MKSTLALVLTTFIWGSTFVVVKDVLADVSPVRWLVLRFGLAAIVLLLAALATRTRIDRATWRAGAIASVPFYLSFLTQTYGLVWASPATSAFLTGFSVVLVPLFGFAFLGRRIGAWTWTGAAGALVGLGLLSLRGPWSMGVGELWTVGTAIAVATHILVLERFAPGRSALALTAAQVTGCAVLAALTLPLEGALLGRAPTPAAAMLTPAVLGAAAYMAVAATALAFYLQTWAQSFLSAVRVGVLFTLEPVFALLMSLALGREALTARSLAGMALILAGMLVVETLGRREPEDARRH